MKYIVLTAKIGLLALVVSMLLPSGASWFIDLLNNNSQSMALVVILCLVIIAVGHQDDLLVAGSKGITDEYTTSSGKVKTAKKLREEHIV